jgi:plastocyanin
MSFERVRKAFPVMFSLGFLVVAGAVVACSGGTQAGGGASGSSLAPITLHYQAVGADDGVVGPDGAKHDAITALDLQPVHVGQKVTIVVTNKDDMEHSLTAPELGLNILVPAAKSDDQPGTVSYTFTPTKAGTFRWYCLVPCDSDNQGWAMTAATAGPGQDQFMAGYINVVQ